MLTLFLRTYARKTSLSEIGVLLMILPFISTFVKPLCCALADRHRAHKQYLMFFLALTACGYGALVIPTFFEQFMQENARLIWYFYAICILIGYSAYGVVFSLGDALAVNYAFLAGRSWGSIRAWSVIAWGVGGYGIGWINETPYLPIYTPGLMVYFSTIMLEIVILFFCSNKLFDMSAADPAEVAKAAEDAHGGGKPAIKANGTDNQHTTAIDLVDITGTAQRRKLEPQPGGGVSPMPPIQYPSASFQGGTFGKGSTGSLNPRMVGAIANMLVEEVGQGVKSSLRLGKDTQSRRRPALSDLVGQETLNSIGAGSTANLSQLHISSTTGGVNGDQHSQTTEHSNQQLASSQNNNFGLVSRADLTGSIGRSVPKSAKIGVWGLSSIGSATGKVIAEELRRGHLDPLEGDPELNPDHQQQQQQQISSTPSDNNNLLMNALRQQHQTNQAATTSPMSARGSLSRALTRQTTINESCQSLSGYSMSNQQELDQKKMAEELQMVLLRIIIKRDPSLMRYLIIFTISGILLFTHIFYFFMHVEHLCHSNGYDFSKVTGYYLLAHTISEVTCFLFVTRYYMPKVGRLGSFLTAGFVFLARFSYYATYFVDYSPHYAILTELSHGFAYGITYTLMSELARESVNQLDDYLPELISLGLVDPRIDPDQLKMPLRATMQGIFSGAFDGLGNGLGVVLGGICLDYYDYQILWAWCSYLALALIISYPIIEWRRLPLLKRLAKSETT